MYLLRPWTRVTSSSSAWKFSSYTGVVVINRQDNRLRLHKGPRCAVCVDRGCQRAKVRHSVTCGSLCVSFDSCELLSASCTTGRTTNAQSRATCGRDLVPPAGFEPATH